MSALGHLIAYPHTFSRGLHRVGMAVGRLEQLLHLRLARRHVFFLRFLLFLRRGHSGGQRASHEFSASHVVHSYQGISRPVSLRPLFTSSSEVPWVTFVPSLKSASMVSIRTVSRKPIWAALLAAITRLRAAAMAGG